MAELHSDPNVLNPILEVDQNELDKSYKKERPEMLASQAQDEIDKTTGLSDIFKDEMSPEEGMGKKKVKKLADEFEKKIKTVLKGSANAFEDSLDAGNQSTSAQFERFVWNKRKSDVINSITSGKIGAEQSLYVAEGCLKFTENVQGKITEELAQEKAQYEDVFKRYDNAWLRRWRRGKSAKFKTFQTATQTTITERLNKLRKNAEKIKTDSGKRVTKTGNDIKRTIRLAPSDDKSTMWAQILQATQLPKGSPFSALDLSAFGSIATSDQQKIDFLEALIQDPDIKLQIGNLNESAARHQHQDSLMETAVDQENAINTPASYTLGTFNDLTSQPFLQNIPPYNETVTVDDLADSLWQELYRPGAGGTPGASGNFPESLFSAYHVSHTLMTPSLKIHILLNHLSGPGNSWNNANTEIKDILVRQKLLRFMKDKSQERMGDVKEWDQTKTLDTIDNLNGDPTNSAVAKLKPLLEEAQKLRVSGTKTSFKTLEVKRKTTSDEVHKLYKEFLANEADIAPEDFIKLKTSWDKVLAVRTFLNTNVPIWVKEQEKHKAQEGVNKIYVKDLEKHLEAKNNQIKEIDKRAKAAKTSKGDSSKKRALNETVLNIISSLDDARNRNIDIDLSDFSELATHLDVLDIENSIAWSKQIKVATPPYLSSFSERIHDSLRTSFADELETKYLEQWAKNDQYELLKKQTSGVVRVSFREVGTLTHLRFPQELNGSEIDMKFRIERNDGKVISLIEEGTGAPRRIRIVGPAVSAGDPAKVTKNAAVFSPSTPGVAGGPTTGKHPTEAIITNLKFVA